MIITHQSITPDFDKYLIDTGAEGWEYFQPMFHRFKAANDPYPHDHPWDFTTTIAVGGYEEKVYTINTDGSWSVETFVRCQGQTHFVKRDCIHQITKLISGTCWTFVVPGEGRGFDDWWEWKFEETGIFRKRHYETEWREYKHA